MRFGLCCGGGWLSAFYWSDFWRWRGFGFFRRVGQHREFVFVERVAHVESAATQSDIVFFGAGEVEQGSAEIFLVEQAHIDLQAIAQRETDFIFAVSQGLVDAGVFKNVIEATSSTFFWEEWPGAVVTRRSRSPTVSLPRRSEPAGVTDSTVLPAR